MIANISAETARVLTATCQANETFMDMHSLMGAIANGKHNLTVFLGRELTKKEAEAKMQELRDLGFKVYGYNVSTTSGGWREPEYTHPAEHRVEISW